MKATVPVWQRRLWPGLWVNVEDLARSDNVPAIILPWTRIDQAQVLIARRSDAERARELLEHARHQAADVGGELARRAADHLLSASFGELVSARW
ncbi:MAG TPA: hypothetical protein VJU80_09680 [Solirubrobacteraceae bacterium]|nr:hypothetical protein [Solirubrobacteraceae bacterium]